LIHLYVNHLYNWPLCSYIIGVSSQYIGWILKKYENKVVSTLLLIERKLCRLCDIPYRAAEPIVKEIMKQINNAGHVIASETRNCIDGFLIQAV